MITVNGRVRATVRLLAEGVDASCVVASSWSSARTFPRTKAAGIAFEIETTEGETYAVDPFEALVILSVRRRSTDGDARTEHAWLGHGEAVEIEGDLRPGRGAAKPTLRARRISATPAAAGSHRIPPRSLSRGQAEKVEPPRAAPEASPAPEAMPESMPAAAAAAPTAAEPATAEPAPPARRPKKKRPDSSGTPTPIQ
jgi:hypothetical protein